MDVGSSRPLLRGAPREQLDASSTQLAQVEGVPLELEPAGLDLGEVEDVVDDRQQRLAERGSRLRVLALLGVEVGLEQQLGHADHAVHRRADLVVRVRSFEGSRWRCPPAHTRVGLDCDLLAETRVVGDELVRVAPDRLLGRVAEELSAAGSTT